MSLKQGSRQGCKVSPLSMLGTQQNILLASGRQQALAVSNAMLVYVSRICIVQCSVAVEQAVGDDQRCPSDVMACDVVVSCVVLRTLRVCQWGRLCRHLCT